MKRWVPFFGGVLAAALLPGSASLYGGENNPPSDGADEAAVTAVADANNRFAFDLYKDIGGDEKTKNVFLSPLSISTALAMTYQGAQKETAGQMRKTLHFPDDAKVLGRGYQEIGKAVNGSHPGYEFSAANSLWPQKGYPFQKDYLARVEDYYGGKAQEVDYSDEVSRADAIRRINTWTSRKTRDKIPEILAKDDVSPLTRLVLVNAIYFKGSWQTAFNPKMTRKADFTTPDSGKVKADMMFQEADFPYAKIDHAQVLEIPYAGKDIVMLVALPDGKDLSQLESSLGAGTLRQWLAALSPRKVKLSLPKFKVGCLYSLGASLGRLGMALAFDEQKADFSGMTGHKDLYISKVIHATFVDVNEQGTEAAGATAMVMGTKCVDLTPEFTADHPFLFLIYDKARGVVLFLGKINKPAVEEAKK